MKLTRKCKKEFEKSLNFKFTVEDYEFVISENEILLNALIIEFFDSVGIVFWIAPYFNHDLGVMNEWAGYNKKGLIGTTHKSRTEATNEAIIKANDLYNENN